MVRLITKTPKRFFAFGCSFTAYQWATWPEIVADSLGVEYHNLGMPGAGNELMFNRLMQADTLYDLNEDDLVMVCWTNICREDRFANGGWIAPGNIYSQREYSEEFVNRYYADPASAGLHDFAYIKAARTLLTARNCQWHFLQMLDISRFHDQWTSEESDLGNLRDLFSTEAGNMLPSFYQLLWDDDIEKKHRVERERYGRFDGHPSPAEHLEYLRNVFEHDWDTGTLARVQALQDEYHQQRLSGLNEFRHLAMPSKNDII